MFLYLLPVGVVCIALMMVGVRVVPASEPPPEPSVGPSVGPLNVWEQVLSRLDAKINRHSVLTWFIETVFVSDEGGVITVRVRNATVGEWMSQHHAGALKAALAEVGRADAALVLASGALLPHSSQNVTRFLQRLDIVFFSLTITVAPSSNLTRGSETA